MLLRGGGEGGAPLEVLLLRRHAGMRTFGNLWVFPGGQLDAADRGDDAAACVTGAAAPAGVAAFPDAALAIAACRETFEEAGILLARRVDGAPPDAAQRARLAALRSGVRGDSAAFFAALRREALRLDTAALAGWSRWITPTIAPRSFDTAFFVAALPAGAAVDVDPGEANESRWIDPRSIRAGDDEAQLPLAPPTLVTLIELARAAGRDGDAAAVLRVAASRRIVPIQPKVVRDGRGVWAVFPWDREFSGTPGESISRFEDLPEPLRSLPSRLLASAEMSLPGAH